MEGTVYNRVPQQSGGHKFVVSDKEREKRMGTKHMGSLLKLSRGIGKMTGGCLRLTTWHGEALGGSIFPKTNLSTSNFVTRQTPSGLSEKVLINKSISHGEEGVVG